jgi:hypothetical protein
LGFAQVEGLVRVVNELVGLVDQELDFSAASPWAALEPDQPKPSTPPSTPTTR